MWWLMLAAGLAGVIPVYPSDYGAVQTPRARPSAIQILLPALMAKDASYTFEIVLAEVKSKNGLPQVRVTTTITKVIEGKTIRIKELIQTVQADATQFTVTADGRDFIFEATYTESPTADGVPPREIVTTFQQMFSGGAVGIRVRLA